ncbi:hypothetical protein HG537_0H03450 [Torulaspora globosa]|uniref:Uncharacterized protein n=1 Tax=Torulaspora globosa TaxID=48254 RepID=A0A7H9I1B1_9SACH|nr:hypothetical protein HG537_0H03450 [Torulaspora sp. CBS 2947]
MEDLKTIDEVLKVERFQDSTPYIHILCNTKLEGSIRFVGYHRLHYEQQYIICTSRGLYLFDGTVLKDSYEFPDYCYSYLYVEPNAKHRLPVHATFMNDGVVKLFEVDHYSITLSTSFRNPQRAGDYGKPFISASNLGAIYLSVDSPSICQFTSTGSHWGIYEVEMGELISFFFMRNGSDLCCLYRHKSTGHIYIEVAELTTDIEEDYRYATRGKYITSCRHRLTSTDQANCYFKKLNDYYAIFITSQYTYVLEPGCSLITVKNAEDLNLRNVIGVSGSTYSIKSRHRAVRVSVFDGSGNVMESTIKLGGKASQTATWIQTSLLAGQIFEQDELTFVDELFSQNSYLLVSSLTGISLVDRMKGSISTILPGRSKKVTDGNCIPKDGSDLDSLIFCGAYTKNHGFIEKRTLIYNSDMVRPIAKKQLSHQPVINLWDTDQGLLYESMAYLYSAATNKRVVSFENGLWLTRNNVKIDVLQEGAISVSAIDESAKETKCCVSVLSKDGVLKVLDYQDNEHSEVLLSLDLDESNIQNGKSAVLYSTEDNCYYIICYHAHGCLKFFRDTTQIRIQSMEMDFFLSDLLLKFVDDALYVILTSVDGRGKILEWESGKCLLDIPVSSESRIKIVDLGRRSSFVLFYNENECILVNLAGMFYGNIDIGTRPVKMLAASCESEEVVYLLDENGCLNTLEFLSCYDYQSKMTSTVWKSDLYDLPGCVPMRLLPFANPRLAVLILNSEENRRLSATVFDYDKMRLFDSQDLGTTDSRLSNVLLRSLDDESIRSESLRIFMKRFLIICCVTDRESIIHIFRLNGYKLERLQTEKVSFPILSIVQAGTKILLGGTQTVCYKIICELGGHIIKLSRTWSPVEEAAERLRPPPLFYSNRNNSCTAMSLLGKYREFDLDEMDACQGFLSSSLSRFGPDPLVQVVTKRLPNRREVCLRSEASSTKTSSFRTSAEILRTLSGSLTTGPQEYMLTVDCSGCVNLFNESGDNPVGYFRLTSPILSVSPIAAQYDNMQLDYFGIRLMQTRPLFMLTCMDGLAHIVSEHHWLEEFTLPESQQKFLVLKRPSSSAFDSELSHFYL